MVVILSSSPSNNTIDTTGVVDSQVAKQFIRNAIHGIKKTETPKIIACYAKAYCIKWMLAT